MNVVDIKEAIESVILTTEIEKWEYMQAHNSKKQKMGSKEEA